MPPAVPAERPRDHRQYLRLHVLQRAVAARELVYAVSPPPCSVPTSPISQKLTRSRRTNRFFLFQAGLIPLIFLITTSTSAHAPAWLADLRTTKDLLSYASLTNRLAGRCLEVIDRLCALLLDAEQPEAMLQDPALFSDVHSLFVGDYGDGMDFLDWNSFGLQGGSLRGF